MDLDYLLLKIILLRVPAFQKKNKLALLLSTAHQSDNFVESGKPEIVELYNETKAGVDSVDQKV